jgi:hypothetical protein
VASVLYDEFGKKRKIPIFTCTTWQEAFEYAHINEYQRVLFLDSGTVILDWKKWQSQIEQYPHNGFIAHIKYHSTDTVPDIDDQAFFLDLQYFPKSIAEYQPESVCSILASNKHIHHDYTPLWIKPGPEQIKSTPKNFLQKLVYYHLNENKKTIVNWHQKLRDNKIYLYNNNNPYYQSLWVDYFNQYKNIAEGQLWIFNNEKLPNQSVTGKILTPGSGLFWMLCAIDQNCTKITICDISKNQVNFCSKLWEDWNGRDYGGFVVDFMSEHNVKHFQLDDPALGKEERVKMLSKKYLKTYVNAKFEELLETYNVDNFVGKWTGAKFKPVDFYNQSILDQDLTKYDAIWCSNILDYKWTLLNHNKECVDQFDKNLKNIQVL